MNHTSCIFLLYDSLRCCQVSLSASSYSLTLYYEHPWCVFTFHRNNNQQCFPSFVSRCFVIEGSLVSSLIRRKVIRTQRYVCILYESHIMCLHNVLSSLLPSFSLSVFLLFDTVLWTSMMCIHVSQQEQLATFVTTYQKRVQMNAHECILVIYVSYYNIIKTIYYVMLSPKISNTI